jgi:hypothetical protein
MSDPKLSAAELLARMRAMSDPKLSDAELLARLRAMASVITDGHGVALWQRLEELADQVTAGAMAPAEACEALGVEVVHDPFGEKEEG